MLLGSRLVSVSSIFEVSIEMPRPYSSMAENRYSVSQEALLKRRWCAHSRSTR